MDDSTLFDEPWTDAFNHVDTDTAALPSQFSRASVRSIGGARSSTGPSDGHYHWRSDISITQRIARSGASLELTLLIVINANNINTAARRPGDKLKGNSGQNIWRSSNLSRSRSRNRFRIRPSSIYQTHVPSPLLRRKFHRRNPRKISKIPGKKPAAPLQLPVF
jgi:hypothetical protein